ncbi:hypothetical protein H072_4676 [Dactylellina haptotyla CBS 200.50]|uniref:F-box domain-containing protein n=1 Tax=Dactylellina haptotyla (strain CBS 200.50) TaxID=1284197 RepID=S8BPQ1_DACHA|nr:hypothetical protein H072_4676 [Dactylellina haptotyla CBS 200.50]
MGEERRLPPELWTTVYSHLAFDALQAVSVCSRTDRALSLPFLFRGVQLSKASIAALDRHLSYLLPHIREISFAGIDCPDTPEGNIVTARELCEILPPFPNITGVHIVHAAAPNFSWGTPLGILRRLFLFPWFHALQHLSIDGTTTVQDSSVGPGALDRLTDNFAAVPLIPFRELHSILFPKRLISASTSNIGQSYSTLDFSKYPIPGSAEHGALHPELFFHYSASTLTALKIKTAYVRCSSSTMFGAPPDPCYPNVTSLEVSLYLCSPHTIGELIDRFPNLHHLVINADSAQIRASTVEEALHPHQISRLPHLRTARLPWPMFIGAEIDMAPDALRYTVNKLVAGPGMRGDSWAYDGGTCGLKYLEYIDFVSGYAVPDDQYWVHFTYIPYIQCDMTVCRITVGEDGHVLRTEPGHRRNRPDPSAGSRRR